ncbi:MAG TPA: FAD-binding oxidoreductase [Gemmatimonadaceae bacterium]|nr:FAD-binding oxidoreductase [Gemmatimonadaceae bacterium]
MSPHLTAPAPPPSGSGAVLVNDVHSQLNPTWVAEVVEATSVVRVQEIVRDAARTGRAVCIAGGRHAMGAQQFADGATLIDMRPLSRILAFDDGRGTVDVEAGIAWPELIEGLLGLQGDDETSWGIAQKQTGADRLTIGGAIAANAHGRGLTMRPFVADVEAVTIIDHRGDLVRCSRAQHRATFELVCGGYGLFGIVVSASLRLVPRIKLRRVVEVLGIDALMESFDDRIARGFRYGDFQFAIDPRSRDFLRRGVFSTYEPVDPVTPIPDDQLVLSDAEWREMLHLAHVDKSRAFELYAEHYLGTSGQIYWSDTHQLTTYIDDYHRELDVRHAAPVRATEMISELYVPRARLADFMTDAAAALRHDGVNVIYGTVRLIERDDDSFLAWAREPWACVIFNLHTEHTPDGLAQAAAAFRRLIDLAAVRGGSYFLTYHRWATREQVLACHPRMPEFLRRKREHDPDGRFQSDWYRHHVRLLGEG